MRALKNTPEHGERRLLGEYLRAQREELLVYLNILKHLEDAVSGGDTERLRHYISLEKESIRRLEKLRRAAAAADTGAAAPDGTAAPDVALAPLRASLSALTREALSRNAAVRTGLTAGMAELRRRIRTRSGGSRGSRHRPSPYARGADPSLVDLHS